MTKLKDKVLEIADIAKACPDNLQVTCFELLLRDLLSEGPRKTTKPAMAKEEVVQEEEESSAAPKAKAKPAEAQKEAASQDDISENELHVKTRHFMKTRGVTIEEINNLFYKEGDAFMPLYEDLKTTRMAEAQVRIALMQSLRNALNTGDFVSVLADVRAEANARKCFDGPNYGRNFNTAAGLFDFDKYDKSLINVRLSEDGKKQLASLIKELQ